MANMCVCLCACVWESEWRSSFHYHVGGGDGGGGRRVGEGCYSAEQLRHINSLQPRILHQGPNGLAWACRAALHSNPHLISTPRRATFPSLSPSAINCDCR